nr:DMT family transporter [uncultured Lichenicoccus sp.]
MQIALYALPVLAGVLNAIHCGTNAQLTSSLSRPWWAVVFACLVSGIAILSGVLINREASPSLVSLAGTPWCAWLGTHLVNVWRIVGAVTMIAGLTLVCLF